MPRQLQPINPRDFGSVADALTELTGYQSDSAELIEATLRYADGGSGRDWQAFADEHYGGVSAAADCVMTLLDTQDLIEWGTSHRYPWLTHRGSDLLEGIDRFGAVKLWQGPFDGSY